MMAPRAKYMGQQQETIMVKKVEMSRSVLRGTKAYALVCSSKELEVLDDEAVLYKLVGPVLIKQEIMESKVNIDRRLK